MIAKWNRLYETDTLVNAFRKPVTVKNLQDDLRDVVAGFTREGRQVWIMDQVP